MAESIRSSSGHFFCFCLKFLFYIYLSAHMWRSEVKLSLFSHHMHSRDRIRVWQQAPLPNGVIEHVLTLSGWPRVVCSFGVRCDVSA